MNPQLAFDRWCAAYTAAIRAVARASGVSLAAAEYVLRSDGERQTASGWCRRAVAPSGYRAALNAGLTDERLVGSCGPIHFWESKLTEKGRTLFASLKVALDPIPSRTDPTLGQ